MRILIFIVLLFGVIITVDAQNKKSNTYSFITLPAQLPEARVTGIAQDERGFIWLATYLGLYKYDGVRTKVFRNGPDADGHMSFNRITRMHEFKNRFLIVEGEKRINIFDTRTEEMVYASPPDRNHFETMIQQNHCYFLLNDTSQKTELMTVDTTGHVTKPGIVVLPDKVIVRACADPSGGLYFMDEKGALWHRDAIGEKLTCKDSVTFAGRSNFEFLPQITCDAQGRVWAFDNGPVSHFSLYRYKESWQPEKVRPLNVWSIMIPSSNPDGVWIYDGIEQEILQLHFQDLHFETILTWPQSRGEINAMLKDKQGNLWISTFTGEGNGLFLAHRHLDAFEKILFTMGKETTRGIASRGIEELYNGQLIIGGQSGIYRCDPEKQRIDSLPLSVMQSNIQVVNIWSFCIDEAINGIWFSKEEGGVFLYKPGESYVTHFESPGDPANNRMLGMIMDHHGILWIGTRNGITWFNTRTHTFESGPETNPTLYGVSCYNWVQTDPNIFWLCSSTGLYRFDSTRTMVQRYDTDTSPRLHSQEVHDVVRDGDQYWIATDYGLHVLNGDSINVYTTKDGLAHNSIAGLAFDDAGHLWAATFRGISKRDKNTGAFQNFYVEDGLPHNEFNRIGRLKSGDGHLYFCSQNGVLRFDPSKISAEAIAQPIVLTNFSTFGKDGSLQRKTAEELKQLMSITIPAKNKFFQVEFALLNYVHAEGNRYAYYLEGLEESWRPLSTLPLIQYNNLKAGPYVLHIRAQTPSGQWSANTLDIQVNVRQYWYQTKIFQIGAFLLLLSIVTLIMRYRSQQKLKMEQMRTRISSDLHDEVGGVLSGVAMQMDVLESRAPEHLRPFMQRVAESSRNAALKMRDVIWSIDSTKEQLEDLLDRMKSYAIELLDPAGIHYKIDHEGMSPHQKLSIDLRQNLYLIYKEALHNILKHAKASEVNIRLVASKTHLTMTITDNGVGISEPNATTGQGLRNMQRRADRLGGELQITKLAGGGTEVRAVVLVR